MAEFFAMGGYAFFVWMSLGITAVVLVANLVGPRSCPRHHWHRIPRLMARDIFKT